MKSIVTIPGKGFLAVSTGKSNRWPALQRTSFCGSDFANQAKRCIKKKISRRSDRSMFLKPACSAPLLISRRITGLAAAASVAFSTLYAGAAPSETTSRRVSQGPSPITSVSGEDWRRAHITSPQGDQDVDSIMQVAELDRSDIGLIGMMIRCTNGKLEPLLIVLDPLPPRTLVQVTLDAGGTTRLVDASLIPTGAGLILPIDLQTQLVGPWHVAKELKVEIKAAGAVVQGVIRIDTLRPALRQLEVDCATKLSLPPR